MASDPSIIIASITFSVIVGGSVGGSIWWAQRDRRIDYGAKLRFWRKEEESWEDRMDHKLETMNHKQERMNLKLDRVLELQSKNK